MADVTYIPEGNNQANNILPWMLASQNGFGGLGGNGLLPGLLLGSGMGYGGFGGFGGFGGPGISAFLGGALGALFPNFFGNFGGNGMGGNGAGFISNQLNNDSGRELLMNAITSQGEATRSTVQNLSTMVGQDFNLVNGDLRTLSTILSNLATQNAVSVPEIINRIQSGDASLASQLCQCCCQTQQQIMAQGYENQLRTLEQTGALRSDIAGVNQNIAATKAAQELSDCKQTYTLTDTMNRNYLALDNKIDALESSRKDREITALTAKVAQLESQNFTTGVVGSAIAPVNAALNAIAREVDDIKCKMPQTVPVQWPNLAAVNTTPYVSGGFYGQNPGFGWGGFGGFNGGINF